MAEKRTPEFWFKQLEREDKKFKSWRQRAQKVVDRYRDERDEKNRHSRRFNLLWANIETLKPATYSKTPVPDVRKRFMDRDPVSRIAAEIIERALVFTIEDYDFDKTLEMCRDDGLLPGRGVAMVEYEADVERKPLKEREGKTYDGDEEREPDGKGDDGTPYAEDVADERVRCKYVPWKLFRHTPVPLWEKVWWVAFGEHMTKADLRKNFGSAIANKVRFEEADEGDDEKGKNKPTQCTVWKIWDKETKKIYFVTKGHDEFLREPTDPPHNLKGFFPVPCPYTPIRTTDNAVPVPEYCEYQDQIDELDKITARINRLIDAIKAKGAYPSALGGTLANIMEGEENQLIPIDDWESLAQVGTLDKAIAWLPIEPLAKVVVLLAERREQLKQEIYELTGISDLIRGSTKSSETATAQQLKGNFGTMRMTPRSRPFERFARDIIRMKAEIIAENYSPETLKKITGMGMPEMPQPPAPGAPPEAMAQFQQAMTAAQQELQQFDAAVALLRDDALRSFRVDIETDSTVAPDQEADKVATTEFVTSITGYLKAAGEIAIAAPQLTPLLMEILKAAASKFKMGRQLEDKIAEVADRLENTVSQPRPDPEAEKAKQELAIKDQESKAEMARKDAEAKQKMALAEREFAHKERMALQENEFKTRELGFKEQEHMMKRDMMQRDGEAKMQQQMMAEAEHGEKIKGMQAERAAPEAMAETLGQLKDAVAMVVQAAQAMQADQDIEATKGPDGRWKIKKSRSAVMQ